MPEKTIPKPKDAMAFLKRKKVIVDPSNDWFNINSGEHAQTFSVAHCASVDMAEQIFQFMNDALENGETLADFKKKMLPLMEKNGWYGRPDKTAKDKKYIKWRLEIMFNTNMKTSYAAGHYRQQMRGAEGRPYLGYKQVQRKTKRKAHEPLHNTAYPINDPFWDLYYPPNGYECDCYTISLSEEQYQSGPYKKGADPTFNPALIDDNWKYNPGQEVYAPSVSRYSNLKKIKMPDGKTAFQHVRESYRKEMAGYSLTQKEYEKWIDKALNKETFQHIPYNIATLDESVVSQIDIDPKIMANSKGILHGARGRKRATDKTGSVSKREIDPDKDFTIDEIKEMAAKLANPDYIFIDTRSPNQRIISYQMAGGKLARVIFGKQTETTSLLLKTFQKVNKNDVLKNDRLKKIYKK